MSDASLPRAWTLPGAARAALLLVMAACAAAFSTPGAAGAAEVRAHLERNPIHIGESVRLVLELDKPPGGLEPDLTPLQSDFEVLGTSASTEIQLVQGNQTATTRWVVELMARRQGELVVPAISVGRHASDPLTLEVRAVPPRAGPGGADLLLEAELTPTRAYVQSQMLYVLRFLRAVNVREGTFSDPGADAAEIMRLGKDISYVTTRGGRRYRVLERRFAVFPQSSGELVMRPVVFRGEIWDDAGSGSIIGQLYSRGRQVRLESDAARAQILPPPAASAGGPWLPASSLQLTEEWSADPLELRVGQPVTRTLRLEARGLAAEQLPEAPTGQPAGIKHYPDQPLAVTRTDGQWVYGVREQGAALVPEQAGYFVLPEIRVAWWDVEADAPREAVVPERTLRVAATGPIGDASAPGIAALPGARGTPVPWWLRAATWQATSALLLLAWLATLARLRARASRGDARGVDVEGGTRDVPAGAARSALRRACADNDAAGARHALLALAAAHWPLDAPRNLQALAERLPDAALSAAIRRVDRTLYGDAGEPWQGDELARLMAAGLPPAERIRREGDALPPLYPGRG